MKHILLLLLLPVFALAQPPLRTTIATDTRAIRRDVPLTNSIRQALEAGTRDFTGRPGPNYWQLQTDYTIEVSLDPGTQTLTGSETIHLHNNSTKELFMIYLRLDHNIFRADVPRGGSRPAETTEGMVLTRLVVNGEAIDLYSRSGLSSDELHQTMVMVSLNNPIKAGSTAVVEIDWHTRLPGGPNGRGHRMTQRWDNTLFQPTQWFPRIAKYDDLRGWNGDTYLGPSEFYNNFGRFDVKINVPGGWIVSGTGLLQNPEEVLSPTVRERLARVLDSDDEIMIVNEAERGTEKATVGSRKLVWHFVADQVNDFAWASSPDYVWRATRAIIPGKGPIPIHMVYLPSRARYFERAGAWTRHALEFYSELWAPYPFPQLTLQDGPSAGMEYPMVINSNQGAADHEAAHQWWPMMLGTNETRYAWMDEGFNTYMNILSGAHRAGKEANLDGMGQAYGSYNGNEDEAPMMWNANYAGMGYGFQAYNKAPMMLSMLGGIVGDEAVQKAMSEYTEVWSFKHPSPWDYIFFMNHALGQNLEWFWYYWLWTTESVDGSIQKVAKKGSKTVVTVHQAGQMPSPIVLKVEFQPGSRAIKAGNNVEVIDEKTLIMRWPVEVWFGGSRTFDAELNFGSRKIEKITLDPGGRFPDRDISDNVWPREGSE